MGEARERSSADKAERGKHDAPSRVPNTLESPVLEARGLAFDGLGNRAVLSLLRAGQPQMKARLSEPGDALEREADRAADAVATGERPGLLPGIARDTPEIQAMPAKDNRLGAALEVEQESGGRVGGMPPDHSDAGPEPLAARLQGGSSLDVPTRALMESHFGESFADVRIHTGHRAAEAAAAFRARAFTIGRDIIFADGEFAPETGPGRHLLAHELAHVVQQSQRGAPAVQRQPAPSSESTKEKPSVVLINAARKSVGWASALFSDDTVEPLKITANELEVGEYTLHHLGNGQYGGAGGRFRWINPWLNPSDPVPGELRYAWGDTVKVVVHLMDIRDFLTASEGARATADEIQSIETAAKILIRYGVSADELLLEETRNRDLEAIGHGRPKAVDPVAWALDFVARRQRLVSAQRDNLFILTEVAKRLDEAPADIVAFIRRGSLLEILKPGSDKIALALDIAIKKLGAAGYGGRADLAALLARLEETLVRDLRRLAAGMLDTTEAGLLRIDRAFVGLWQPRVWSPAYLWREIEKARHDPDLKKSAAERDAIHQAADTGEMQDNVALFHDRTIDFDTFKANEAQRKQLRKEADDRYRATVAERSALKLSSVSEIESLLAARSDQEAQSLLKAFLAEGRKKVNRARELIADPRILYAADLAIAAEKDLLSQELGAEHARVANDIIDRLARERRSQTSIWDDIWKILQVVALLVPGPAGLVIRVGMAAVDLDKKLKDIAFRTNLHGAGLRSVGPDPGEALTAVAEFGIQVVPDVALSKPFAAAERASLNLGRTGRTAERELAQAGERGAARVEGKAGGGAGGEPPGAPRGAGGGREPPGEPPPAAADDIRGVVEQGRSVRMRGEAQSGELRVASPQDIRGVVGEAGSTGIRGADEVAASTRTTVRGSPRPGPGETLAGSSEGQMSRAAQRIISNDPQHPLRFLVDSSGKFKPQRGLQHSDLIDRPDLVQMGHITSKKLGEPDRLMLQGAWENQLSNISVEASHIGGAVLEQTAISIGGIAVDARTARFWERIGWLPAGTVDNAPLVIP